MGIAKAQFNDILGTIFTEGNVIKLYTKTPTEGVETDGTLLAGDGVVGYEIKSGDFTVNNGEAISAKHMMLYLYEGTTAECDGFGVFKKDAGNLLYFGKFEIPITLDYNDVPAIKKYNSDKGEGIRITITSTEASATTE